MINDTERKAFEEWAVSQRDKHNLPYFVIKAENGLYVDEGTNHAWEAWQAALSTKAQDVGEWVMVPREPTKAMLDAGDRAAQVTSKRGVDPYIANLEAVYQAMLSASPAPALCTPEEAAELAMRFAGVDFDDPKDDIEFHPFSARDIARIINADRAKRNV